MPKVSVVIPCYNHGKYIDEAVNSVLAQTFIDFEIIIVNDGSTDEQTVALLKDYKSPKTTVIHTAHQGLSEARNAGIRNSSGEYILPLDADDKISPGYLADAVKVLDNDREIKIVYCEATWFGGKSGPLNLAPFSMKQMLLSNIIFCSAFFRRHDYNLTKGYDKALLFYEDWDFWLSLLEIGEKVYKIPKTHFYYRFREGSMLNNISPEASKYITKQIYLNHITLYARYCYDPNSLYYENLILRKEKEALLNSKDIKAGRLVLGPLRVAKRAIKIILKKREPVGSACTVCPEKCERPPAAYHFLMTNYCNANCIFCNQRFGHEADKDMTLDKFKIIVTHIPVISAGSFNFTGGGEPFLCKDLIPIIQYVNESFPWIKVIIRTNGLLLGQYAQEIARLNIAKLEISIHGLAKTNDMIIQKKGTEAIFEGIAALNRHLKELHNNIFIEFETVVSMLNIKEIPELIKKAGKLCVGGIFVFFCRYFSYRKGDKNLLLKDEDSLFFHKRQYNLVIKKSKKLAKSLGIDFLSEPLFSSYFLRLKKKRISCCQPWCLMLIDGNGEIYPCTGGEEWFKEKVRSGHYHFGNLLKENLEQCWNNPAYIMIRKSCISDYKSKPITECENCHSTVCFNGPDVKYAHIIRPNDNC